MLVFLRAAAFFFAGQRGAVAAMRVTCLVPSKAHVSTHLRFASCLGAKLRGAEVGIAINVKLDRFRPHPLTPAAASYPMEEVACFLPVDKVPDALVSVGLLVKVGANISSQERRRC